MFCTQTAKVSSQELHWSDMFNNNDWHWRYFLKLNSSGLFPKIKLIWLDIYMFLLILFPNMDIYMFKAFWV
jgi:hypothetical protein